MPWRRIPADGQFPPMLANGHAVARILTRPDGVSHLCVGMGLSVTIPVADLLWLLRESKVDWRAGLQPE